MPRDESPQSFLPAPEDRAVEVSPFIQREIDRLKAEGRWPEKEKAHAV